MRDSSETIIAFYEGAYGRTIRIDVQAESWLMNLRESVSKLLRTAVRSIDISLMNNVRMLGVSSFTLLRTEEPVSPYIYSSIDKKGSVSIFWFQDVEQLETLIALINGLLDHDEPGHQYLTNENDGILVELAYEE